MSGCFSVLNVDSCPYSGLKSRLSVSWECKTSSEIRSTGCKGPRPYRIMSFSSTGCRSSFFGDDYDTNDFSLIQRYQLGHENRNVYHAKPVLAVPVNDACQFVVDYYPLVIRVHEDLLHSPVREEAVIPVPAWSFMPFAVPASEIRMVEASEVSKGPLFLQPSASLTLSASLFTPPLLRWLFLRRLLWQLIT